MKLSAFLLVVMFSAAALACGNPPTATDETQTAAAGAATPTTQSPPATPVALAPVSGAAARTDCPGFSTFHDLSLRLSFCAPVALNVLGGLDDIGSSLTTLEMAKPYMHLAVEVTPRGSFVEGVDVAKQCAVGLVPSQLSGEVVHLTVAGLDAVGCHVVGLSPTGGTLEEISVTAATRLGGTSSYLNLLAIWETQDSAKPLIDRIISTVTLMP